MSEAAWQVIVVCVGNICRSPAAEVLLRRDLHDLLPLAYPRQVRVRSAGSRAPRGHGVHPSTAAALAVRGLGAPHHSAHRMTAADLAPADLVLTAERSVRSDVVRLRPASVAMAFTLTEFARLSTAVPDERLTLPELVVRARALRGMEPLPYPDDDDVADPIGRPATEHEAAVTRIEEATRAVAQALARGW